MEGSKGKEVAGKGCRYVTINWKHHVEAENILVVVVEVVVVVVVVGVVWGNKCLGSIRCTCTGVSLHRSFIHTIHTIALF